MPTLFYEGPYRFFFYSADGVEPVHVHIQKGTALAKFWLFPGRLDSSRGFARAELRELERLVVRYQERIAEAWHEFFGA